MRLFNMSGLSLATLVFGAFLPLVSTSGSAKELKWTHFGPRPLGMGNAFVAVADDYNALFYNPAGIARLDDWTGSLFEFSLEFSQATYSLLSDLQELAASSSGDINSTLDFISEHTGETHHFGLQLTPHLIFPNFGFGIGLELETTAVFHRQISTDLAFGPRVIMPFTYARNFLGDRLSVGASVKFVARGGVDREFSIQTINALAAANDSEDPENDDAPKLEDFVEGGYGMGFDFGLLFTPIKTMEPTIGISVIDAGGTVYEKANVAGEALGTPDKRLPTVNTGISLKPIQTDSQYVLFAMDAHAINQPIHYSKKFNLGLEWGYGKIVKLQTGLHQGQLSGGFQFDVKLLKIRLVAYTEQLGQTAAIDDSKADTRFLINFKMII